MILSTITLLFRNLLRNLTYSFLTMSSLVLGITMATLMFLWVSYELTYNHALADRERVFALLTNDLVEGEIITQEGNNAPLMDFLTSELPEIESVTRIDNARALLTQGEKSVQKSGIYADTSFFTVHPVSLVDGNMAKPLPDNHSIAISKTLADLLFENGDVVGKTIGVNLSLSLSNPMLWLGLIGIAVLTAVMAGGYPAFLLSSFKPAVVLKGNLYSGLSGAGLRKALVVFQFSLSVIIIFCSWVMWQQTNFLLKKDLGYDKHRIINIWLDDDKAYSLDNLKSSVLNHTSIEAVALSGASPMEINGYTECNRISSPLPSPLFFYGANIDENVLTTLNFELMQGRNFSPEFASDSSHFIITQKAAELLGFKNPIGERIRYNMFGPQEGEIIGVIKDFQNDDIHTAEKPVVFVYGKPEYLTNLFVRYQEDKLEEAVNHIKAVFDKLQPGIPVSYSFLDTDFENQLFREKQLGHMSVWFTVIAIIIACLGLLGLVLFTTQRRTKEIGIRKVLGASVPQMAVMLCRDFVLLVTYALMLAFPIAYFLMQSFLEGYPSRVTISIDTFMLVGVSMMALVLITITYQSLSAARQNPTESLKTE